MTTVTKYICDFCHTEYDTEAKCTACENSHVAPERYDSAKYLPGKKYPSHVYFETEDNHLVDYGYLQDLGELPTNLNEQE